MGILNDRTVFNWGGGFLVDFSLNVSLTNIKNDLHLLGK